MRICLISAEHSPWGGLGHSERRLATMLSARHEVTLVHGDGAMAGHPSLAEAGVREIVAEASPLVRGTVFANEMHRSSAAVFEAIAEAYGGAGPDYVEVADYRAQGLVPMQVRRAGGELFRSTMFAVRIASSAELIDLHDCSPMEVEGRLLADLEREQLRLADRIVWRGGDVLDFYRRHYPFELPDAVRIRAPYDRPADPPSAEPRATDRPLRMLYVGRLQRSKGAIDLAEACLRLPCDDWELTMIGADTPTAPAGQSVRQTIEVMLDGDPRLKIEEPVDYQELQRRWADYDLLVVPSRFEVWSNVTVEAMRAGLPVLATPLGGPAELVAPGVTGWHTEDLGSCALGRAIEALLEDREEIERVRSAGAIFERFLELTDPEPILDSYERMFGELRPAVRERFVKRHASEALVTGIVPHFHTAEYVGETVESLLRQTHRNLEVLIVNDGSFAESDAILDELAEDPRVRVVCQLNGGESSARNLGACLARGEYVAMVDADNALEPEFVSHALEIFAREPWLAYVSCWLRFVDEDGSPHEETAGYAPLGNRVVRDDLNNWDGDTVAVLPRRLLTDLGYGYETDSVIQSDWELYRRLGADGRFGVVIPDWLMRYRVLGGSLLRAHGKGIQERSWEEALARKQLRPTRWIANA